MDWIVFAALGYLLQAISVLGDKIILGKLLPRPASYAFWQGILSLGVFIFIPFGFALLPLGKILISFLAGIIWLYALLVFFYALLNADASRVQPVVLGFTPLILLSFESFGAKTNFSALEIIAAGFLILGSVVLTMDFENKIKNSVPRSFVAYSILAAFLFACSIYLMKVLFLEENFFNILIWTRFGLFLGAISLLIFTAFRKSIFSSAMIIRRPKASGGVVLNKIFGATGAFFISFALARGPATLVNALQGLQYFFLFVLAAVFSIFFPKIIKESLNRKALIQKVSGIILVSLGLYFLIFLSNGTF
ncbi:hypothetical protein HYW53_02705 [Candidatus Giovannonibacteria bacterium]|nr:hypothetical protein [Candidatus Giovannonibacteria bacterium]